MYGTLIGSFIGGAIAGLGKAYCYAFVGSGGISALPAFIFYLDRLAEMIATYILYKEN